MFLSTRRVAQLYQEGVQEINEKLGDELWRKTMF
jgi:hypothetical protein